MANGATSTHEQRIYDQFTPRHRLVQQGRAETLVIELQGFRKEQLKVQIDKHGMLRISGERRVGDNKWIRLLKEYQVPEDCDASAIRAKFENGLLKISMPKLVTRAQDKDAAVVLTGPPLPPNDGKPRGGQEFTSQQTMTAETDAGKQQQAVKAEHENCGLKDNAGSYWRRQTTLRMMSVAIFVIVIGMIYAAYKLRNAYASR